MANWKTIVRLVKIATTVRNSKSDGSRREVDCGRKDEGARAQSIRR